MLAPISKPKTLDAAWHIELKMITRWEGSRIVSWVA